MDERLAAALRVLPDYPGQHVVLSASALSLGIVLSLPLALVAARRPQWRWPLFAVASAIQTIPGLALLALTLYSMLPILRNGIAGLCSVDPTVIEAAKGVGMTDGQRLLRVEVPLA